jgi:hypothetical protein
LLLLLFMPLPLLPSMLLLLRRRSTPKHWHSYSVQLADSMIATH